MTSKRTTLASFLIEIQIKKQPLGVPHFYAFNNKSINTERGPFRPRNSGRAIVRYLQKMETKMESIFVKRCWVSLRLRLFIPDSFRDVVPANWCHGWDRNLYNYWYRGIDSSWSCPDYFGLDFSRVLMSAIFFAEFAPTLPIGWWCLWLFYAVWGSIPPDGWLKDHDCLYKCCIQCGPLVVVPTSRGSAFGLEAACGQQVDLQSQSRHQSLCQVWFWVLVTALLS